MALDNHSGWSTAPAAARAAGDGEVYRFFETPESAEAFMAKLAARAAKQKRYRQRLRENAVVLRAVALPGEVVSALIEWGIEWGHLDRKAELDPRQIEREVVAVLTKWSQEWRG